MPAIAFPTQLSALCLGRACAGVWSRGEGLQASTAFSGRMVLEAIGAFLVLWVIFVTFAVLRELIHIRESRASLDRLTIPEGEDKQISIQTIVRRFGQLNEECPVHIMQDEDPESCTICLENIEAGCPQRNLSCSHSFHVSCIDRWVLQTLGSRQGSSIPLCPVCKSAILKASVPFPQTEETQSLHAQASTSITDDVEAALASESAESSRT